jgi:cytochrome c553
MLLFATLAAAVAGAGSLRAAQAEQSLPSMPARLAEMQHHYLQVTLIHEAIIRGDLPAVQSPARELAAMPAPVNTPPRTAPFAKAIAAAAELAAGAQTLSSAASAATLMLLQCGECHRAAGVLPAPSTPRRPDLGGLVGHMLEHQRAVDEMLQGLLMPSVSRWAQGTARLKTAPLRPDQFPRDPRLPNELTRTDALVHEIGGRAAQATDAPTRATVYGDLLTTCAECHGLHREIWGPKRQGTQ